MNPHLTLLLLAVLLPVGLLARSNNAGGTARRIKPGLTLLLLAVLLPGRLQARSVGAGLTSCRMKPGLILLLLAALLPAGLLAQPGDADGPVRKLGDIEFEAISELSGLARSRRYPDAYWLHNDSGDQPRLFAVDGQGRVIIPDFLQGQFHGEQPEAGKQPWPGLVIETAVNIDWEDIAVDEDFIYIADMGNNGNARRDLGVYLVAEPNPRSRPQARPLKFVPVRYPEQDAYPPAQWHFDSESLFVQDGTLYFLTKHRGRGIMQLTAGTRLYRLDTMDSDRINDLTLVEARDDMVLPAAAELSPDGSMLAVAGYTELWIFSNPDQDRWLSADARRLPLDIGVTGLIEALTWRDAQTLVIGNEAEEWFTVAVDAIPPDDGASDPGEGLRQFRQFLQFLRRR